MNYTNRKYVILNISEIPSIDFSEVMEDSEETLRYSANGQQVFVKWEGDTPSFLNLWIHIGKTFHTHAEIKRLLNTPDWILDEVNPEP